MGKLDTATNEIENLDLSTYPSIKIYPKGAKNKPIDYVGNLDPSDIKRWLGENSQALKKHLKTNKIEL